MVAPQMISPDGAHFRLCHKKPDQQEGCDQLIGLLALTRTCRRRSDQKDNIHSETDNQTDGARGGGKGLTDAFFDDALGDSCKTVYTDCFREATQDD
ncbi:hypothetical protein CU100_09835 [Phyllobacterium endophyticum]|uniref:Uncharacterized protein n=1 Tax=Phyllobacterium endophyticum TaxID=1149773 RepID=A0A2P7AUS5_9HYPH|nr:hypothetical protein CU100_09835 [Phyllobacterium endophyticum]